MTPQDIQNQEFAKAVFGGYDMAAVDDFLEQLTADYTALYKDNMVLKGKLKVLVEKVEEYRSTEDAMRMALLTAQKMSDDMLSETQAKCDAMVAEAQKKCDDMLAEASRASEESRAQVEEDISHEDMKLEAAKVKTAAFVAASRQIVDQYGAFLTKLETATAEYGGAREEPEAPGEAEEPAQEGVVSPEPERVRTAAAPEPAPAPEPEPEPEAPAKEPQETPQETPQDNEPPAPQNVDAQPEPEDNVRRYDPDAGTRRIDIEAVRRIYSGKGDSKRAWDEEDELATPRPKFDFSDLRFGANYADEGKKSKKDKDK